MYKIIYNKKAIEKIDVFTKGYKSSFIKLFEDSGLFMEEEIVNNYIKLGNKLHDLIFSNIDSIFVNETVFGISITESGKKFIIITINNFRLFIYYTEDKKNYLRMIENIDFFRK